MTARRARGVSARASHGNMLIPAAGVIGLLPCVSGYSAPATSHNVGMTSIRCISWSVQSRPGFSIPAGQWAIIGEAMPPSWTNFLYLRSGVFE